MSAYTHAEQARASLVTTDAGLLAARELDEVLGLTDMAGAMHATKAGKAVLDMDSSEFPVHGSQEGSASGGHFRSRCYHPLLVFDQHGDCGGAHLRPGNVHSEGGWRDLLEPLVDRYRAAAKRIYFRGDAAFASPDVYECLEEEGIPYAMRLKANSRLQEEIEHLLTRPVGRPPAKPKVFYHVSHARRTVFQMAEVAVEGELFAEVLARIRSLAVTLA